MTAPTDPGTGPQPGSERRLRASDDLREAVVHRLHHAVGRGQLTVEECTERTEAAYRAKFVDELPPLTADLPDPAPVAPGWHALASTAALQARMSLLGAPSWAAADSRRRWLVVLTGVLLTLLLVIALTAAAAAAALDVGAYHAQWHDWDRG